MVRILYVLPALGVGGAERSLLALLRSLDRARFEPHLCSLERGGALRGDFEALGVPVYELGVAPGLREAMGARLVALAVRLRPRIVHSRLVLANLWGRLAGRACGAKVICEERGLELERPALATWLNRATGRLSHLELANAEAVAAVMRSRDRVDERRLRLVPGGIDPAPFDGAPAPEPEFDLASVHRLVAEKGTIDLLEALALVRRERPRARLLLVGDGPARARLEARAARSDLAGAVAFAGERADVAAQLRRARLFALLSREEGFPNAVLEAMASALPVVATATGGMGEVVEAGVTGALVPVGEPGAAAEAALRYLADPALAAAHGEAGRRRVRERFSFAAVAGRYERLYQELLDPARPQAGA